MRVLVYDCTDRERMQHVAESFVTGSEVFGFCNDGCFKAPDWDSGVDVPSEVELVVLHENNRDSFKEYDIRPHCLISYTGGAPLPSSSGQLWIQRKVTAQQPLLPDEAQAILDWFGAGRDHTLLPEILSSKLELPLEALTAAFYAGLCWQHRHSGDISSTWSEFEQAVLGALTSPGWEWQKRWDAHFCVLDTLLSGASQEVAVRLEGAQKNTNGPVSFKRVTETMAGYLNEEPNDDNLAKWNDAMTALRDALLCSDGRTKTKA